MLRHNLILVFRHLQSNKLYSSVILLSLIVGFTCANLMISFMATETGADNHHNRADHTYQIFSSGPFGERQLAFIPNFVRDYFADRYPELVDITQVINVDRATISHGQIELTGVNIVATDTSFINFFVLPEMIYGKQNKTLEKQNILLSNVQALALFGSEDAVGKSVIFKSDTTIELIVAGVFKKSDYVSHLVFDAIINHDMIPKQWTGGATYVSLADKSEASQLIQKVNTDSERPGLLGNGKLTYFLEPLSDSYFNPANTLSFMKTRSHLFMRAGYVVCALILFISTFNFINLFLLLWQGRKKEIGIKKTLGVTPAAMLTFSFVEAIAYVVSAYAAALVLTILLIPLFNTMLGATLQPGHLANLRVLAPVGIVVLASGIVVICISVVRQWRMKPISLMTKDASKATFSRLLFTIQFIISIALSVGAVTIIQQMKYVENAPLGFDKNMIQVNVPDKTEIAHVEVLKQRLSSIPAVSHVSVCSGNPISANISARYELDNGEFYVPYLFFGDEEFVKTLNLTVLYGRVPTMGSKERLVNETLVREFGFNDAIGQKIPGTKDEVISGVVSDFTCSSFKLKIPPVIIALGPRDSGKLLIGYSGSNTADFVSQINEVWTSVFSGVSFNYNIIQEDLMRKYKEDVQFFRIVITFSIVSIVLSGFGLFALSWAVIQRRTKEIGIRKVLGATPADILHLLTLTFTRRIAIAFLVGAPLAYYLTNQWLSGFVNRIELNVWIFVLPAFGVMVVSALTLSYQTLRAVRTNPVEEIRND